MDKLKHNITDPINRPQTNRADLKQNRSGDGKSKVLC